MTGLATKGLKGISEGAAAAGPGEGVETTVAPETTAARGTTVVRGTTVALEMTVALGMTVAPGTIGGDPQPGMTERARHHQGMTGAHGAEV